MPEVSAKPDWKDARQRVQAWWEGSSLGRPAVFAKVPRADAPRPFRDDRPRRQREPDPQWQLARVEWEPRARAGAGCSRRRPCRTG